MFQADVLVGKHTQGYPGMKRPPPLGSKKHGLLYNSVVDNVLSPQVYVIFNSDQSYPTYLIEYDDVQAGYA
ncbi:hypothetical protein CAPTEDRAFT_125584 [Capitella teleta]|nr:hypothetical protein CAPTEDRAFT_125584 [Capitella teleta]|eukprot:ELU16093.1 hypothetical protein CAPTEDRAFT_125584 [Capitella teleta]